MVFFFLIKAFFRLTGVPMVLNTSFNTLKSEPITETPSEGVHECVCVCVCVCECVCDCVCVCV